MPIRSADNIDKATLLRQSWLKDFPDETITEAAGCGTLRTVEDGTLLHARGAEADGIYTIASGAVRFTRTTPDGQSSTIAVLAAPNWFGEVSLFDGQQRTHDGYATGPTVVMFHTKSDFQRLLARYPAIYERFLKMLSLRLRAVFDLVEESAVTPLDQRLARRLLELAHIQPSATTLAPLARRREVPLTQEELGQLLGRSRQSISKFLHLWEQSGLIQNRYGRISIKQPDALQKVAYPDRAPHRNGAARQGKDSP